MSQHLDEEISTAPRSPSDDTCRKAALQLYNRSLQLEPALGVGEDQGLCLGGL